MNPNLDTYELKLQITNCIERYLYELNTSRLRDEIIFQLNRIISRFIFVNMDQSQDLLEDLTFVDHTTPEMQDQGHLSFLIRCNGEEFTLEDFCSYLKTL